MSVSTPQEMLNKSPESDRDSPQTIRRRTVVAPRLGSLFRKAAPFSLLLAVGCGAGSQGGSTANTIPSSALLNAIVVNCTPSSTQRSASRPIGDILAEAHAIPVRVTEENYVEQDAQLQLTSVTGTGANATAHMSVGEQPFNLPLSGTPALDYVRNSAGQIIFRLTTQNQGAQALIVECPQ